MTRDLAKEIKGDCKIPSSIKTRIETLWIILYRCFLNVKYHHPLKQGLKQIHMGIVFLYIQSKIPSSIKTRIETTLFAIVDNPEPL